MFQGLRKCGQFVALVTVGVVLIAGCSPVNIKISTGDSTSKSSDTGTTNAPNPEPILDQVDAFYASYLNCMNQAATDGFVREAVIACENALPTKSDSFLDTLHAKPDYSGADLILCAQDIPSGFKTRRLDLSDLEAPSAIVEFSWFESYSYVRVDLIPGDSDTGFVIDDIACLDSRPGNVSAPDEASSNADPADQGTDYASWTYFMSPKQNIFCQFDGSVRCDLIVFNGKIPSSFKNSCDYWSNTSFVMDAYDKGRWNCSSDSIVDQTWHTLPYNEPISHDGVTCELKTNELYCYNEAGYEMHINRGKAIFK